jgi:hypothetical protein
MVETAECQRCGAMIPDKMAFMVIHAERHHPELYAEMLRDYYADLRQYDLLEAERNPLDKDDAVEIEVE